MGQPKARTTPRHRGYPLADGKRYVGKLDTGKKVYVTARDERTLAFAVFVTRASGRVELVERIVEGDHRPQLIWNGGHYERTDRVLTATEMAEEGAGWWRRHSLRRDEFRAGTTLRGDARDVVAVHIVELQPTKGSVTP